MTSPSFLVASSICVCGHVQLASERSIQHPLLDGVSREPQRITWMLAEIIGDHRTKGHSPGEIETIVRAGKDVLHQGSEDDLNRFSLSETPDTLKKTHDVTHNFRPYWIVNVALNEIIECYLVWRALRLSFYRQLCRQFRGYRVIKCFHFNATNSCAEI